MTVVESDLLDRVEAVRRFNRFYTRRIGVLEEGLLWTPFSLTEARVLYEVAHHEGATASELGRELGLDAGYLSRILGGFEKRGFIRKTPSDTDGRQFLLRLTAKGRKAFARLDLASRTKVEAMLVPLSNTDQDDLVRAMRSIEGLLGVPSESHEPYIIRPHQPGDMGWVVHRHGVLYSEEYGWDERFEALVAEIVAKFIQNFDPARERCWIAEREGENVGSVFLVKQSDTVGQLRLLLVEPKARGLGIGGRLVDECLRFARRVGYRKVALWTNDVLVDARRIYERAGFRLVSEKPHHSFGRDLVGQTWEVDL
jgi:DNA-binding MarR family transcriptional regulator/N-acetylglutamate synthase-like GNAT family acetyltransferase